jgi:hypothetical protein
VGSFGTRVIDYPTSRDEQSMMSSPNNVITRRRHLEQNKFSAERRVCEVEGPADDCVTIKSKGILTRLPKAELREFPNFSSLDLQRRSFDSGVVRFANDASAHDKAYDLEDPVTSVDSVSCLLLN